MPIKQLVTHYPNYQPKSFTELDDDVQVCYEEYNQDGDVIYRRSLIDGGYSIEKNIYLGKVVAYYDNDDQLINYYRQNENGEIMYMYNRKIDPIKRIKNIVYILDDKDADYVWERRKRDQLGIMIERTRGTNKRIRITKYGNPRFKQGHLNQVLSNETTHVIESSYLPPIFNSNRKCQSSSL